MQESDAAALWDEVAAGRDQGARATLRDIGSGHIEADRLMSERTRPPIIEDRAAGTFHHRTSTDLRLPPVPRSVHWIESGSLAIPMQVERAESPVLIVTLHGVLPRAKYQLPRFEWMNTLQRLGCSMLSFGDATMDLAPSLEGGWWLGTPSTDLIERMASLVERTRASLQAEHLIFAGSSMGGFGALQLGAFFPDATVVAFNPQTDFRKYHATHVRAVLGRVFGADGAPVPVRVSVLERYAATGNGPGRIRYVTNSGDQHHLQEHFEPFAAGLDAVASSSLERTWRDDGPGHVKAPPSAFRAVVEEEIGRMLGR